MKLNRWGTVFAAAMASWLWAGAAFAQTPVEVCLRYKDQNGNLSCVDVSTSNPFPVGVTPGGGAVSHASVSSLGAALVAKASPGSLYGFNCTAITGGGAGYCVAYNATAAPSAGALTGSLVLDACYFGTSPAGCSLSRIPVGGAYSAGIVILVTSAATPFTYTTGTDTAFISADYQ